MGLGKDLLSGNEDRNWIHDRPIVKLLCVAVTLVAGIVALRHDAGSAPITLADLGPSQRAAIAALSDEIDLEQLAKAFPASGAHGPDDSTRATVKINSYARTAGTGSRWRTSGARVAPGELVHHLIRFENRGGRTLDDVTVGANLSDHLTPVEGSTVLINGTTPQGMTVEGTGVASGGIDAGSYRPGAVGYVVFTSRVDDRASFDQLGLYTLHTAGVVRPSGANEFSNSHAVDVEVR